MRDEGSNIQRVVTRYPLPVTRYVMLMLAAALLAGCATAHPGTEKARQIVDRAQPLRCEAAALEGRLKAAEPGSAEAAGLAASLEQAKSRLKWHYMATMDEYIAVMKELPFEDRKAIYRYSDEAAGRCATASRKSSVWSVAPSGRGNHESRK